MFEDLKSRYGLIGKIEKMVEINFSPKVRKMLIGFLPFGSDNIFFIISSIDKNSVVRQLHLEQDEAPALPSCREPAPNVHRAVGLGFILPT